MTEATIVVGTVEGNVFIDFRPDQHVKKGESHYVTPAKARILAESLNRCADKVDSAFPTGWKHG
jgi:hypothetical protein